MSGKLCKLLGSNVPLILAPMNGTGDVGLAASVARAGATGSVPGSGLAPSKLEELIDGVNALRLPSEVVYNFFAHNTPNPLPTVDAKWVETLRPYYTKEGLDTQEVMDRLSKNFTATPTFSEAQFEVLKRREVKLISFHFGLPEKALWERIKKETSMVTMSSATTVEEALFLQKMGVDVIIAQGYEAGGHRGCFLPETRLSEQMGTFSLVPCVRKALGTDACVVAAGGIVDANTVRSALQLGADGVQCGTAFLLCNETKTNPTHRAAIRRAQQDPTYRSELTNILSGRPARGLRNTLMRELGAIREDAPPFPYGVPYLALLRQLAEPHMRPDYSQLWVGQNCTTCEECTVAEMVAKLTEG